MCIEWLDFFFLQGLIEQADISFVCIYEVRTGMLMLLYPFSGDAK